MSGWAVKRFWKEATIAPQDGGFGILLDGRPVRTPAKRPLIVPGEAMARAIAAEWDAQEGKVDPSAMPWTRSANAAIDKVAMQRAEVEAHLASYAGTDLICYRASDPEELRLRQGAGWDPVLDWLAARFDVRLEVTSGVMPVAQDAAAIARLGRVMAPMNDFALTGFHDLVTISGSYSLALAVAKAERAAAEAWALSRIDEDWQIEQWGADEEAAEMAELKRRAFLHAADFFSAA